MLVSEHVAGVRRVDSTMSPLVSKLLFALLSVAVPITWGVAVNALFRKLRPPRTSSDDDGVNKHEPTIEYYI